jgi:hypothetical protein
VQQGRRRGNTDYPGDQGSEQPSERYRETISLRATRLNGLKTLALQRFNWLPNVLLHNENRPVPVLSLFLLSYAPGRP